MANEEAGGGHTVIVLDAGGSLWHGMDEKFWKVTRQTGSF